MNGSKVTGGKNINIYFVSMKGCHFCEKQKEILKNMKWVEGIDYINVDKTNIDTVTKKYPQLQSQIVSALKGFPTWLKITKSKTKVDVLVGLQQPKQLKSFAN